MMDIAICRFSASFSHKYDVTDAMLQDNEKMKVQYLRSLLFDLFETRGEGYFRLRSHGDVPTFRLDFLTQKYFRQDANFGFN